MICISRLRRKNPLVPSVKIALPSQAAADSSRSYPPPKNNEESALPAVKEGIHIGLPSVVDKGSDLLTDLLRRGWRRTFADRLAIPQLCAFAGLRRIRRVRGDRAPEAFSQTIRTGLRLPCVSRNSGSRKPVR